VNIKLHETPRLHRARIGILKTADRSGNLLGMPVRVEERDDQLRAACGPSARQQSAKRLHDAVERGAIPERHAT
jgi:hypothetical protein